MTTFSNATMNFGH